MEQAGGAAPRRVAISGFPSIFAQSEGGLLGMVADPAADDQPPVLHLPGGGHRDGRRTRRARAALAADQRHDGDVSDGAPVVTGIPLGSGRHSGCRLRFGTDGYLYVGTGDAAIGTNPQNLASLGGKVLRVGWDGSIPADNPFVARGGNARYVYNYGHRNVQGLALRPGTSELWTAEHGTDRDDEVNSWSEGANYGWDPVPGYDESTPMTDLTKFPSATPAMWSSGFPTVATSGAAFLTDPRWGAWRGALAVAQLKGQGISLMRMNPTPGPSRVVATTPLPQAEGFGRIRTLMQGPDGALWFTTSNGTNDRIVRIAPTATVPVRAAGHARPVAPASRLARTGTRSASSCAAPATRSSCGAAATTAPRGPATPPRASPPPTPRRPPRRRPGGSTSSPACASGSVVHSWYRGGPRLGSTDLGGDVVAQHAVSLGDGTLDVFAVSAEGVALRQHWNGNRSGAAGCPSAAGSPRGCRRRPTRRAG